LGFLAEALVGCLAAERAVRAMVVVVVLPLLQFVGEQAGVVDHLAFEEPVELFGVDAVVRALGAVDSRASGHVEGTAAG